jgi:outer membrane protein assembly factor BamD (BamD/ComL family)
MADYRQDTDGFGGLNKSRFVAAAMTVGGFLFGLAATVWMLGRFVELSGTEDPAPTAAQFVGAVALFLGAWGVAALLWGGAQMLRRIEDLLESQRGSTAVHGSPRAAFDADVIEKQTRRLEELAIFMRDMRDIALLSDDERKVRAAAESAALTRQLEKDVPILLREHKWHEAQRRVQFAKARFPSVPAWDELANQVEQAREKFEAHDIENAQREIEDLSALSAWDRALTVVRELQHRHPDSPRVAELVQRVEVNLNRAANEERTKLMAKAQDATNSRNWRGALEIVETVLQKYPKSPEARDLRHQLPTLRANAEIQHRQQLEHDIRDLIKQQRFTEALRTARELIGRYPDSPQANVLRPQLPKLEQKAGETW